VVPTSGTAQFSAAVTSPSAAIQWEVNRVPGGNGSMGTIDSNGLYRAPNTVPGAKIEVSAVLQSDSQKFATADVTVVDTLVVSPRQAAVTTSQSVQFQATGMAATGGGVTWTSTGGTVSSEGLFIPSGSGAFTVTATSRTILSMASSATVYVTSLEGQSSWRNDAGLTGQNQQELALNPATVGSGFFGKLSSCAVDGQVHAQPLYAANLPTAAGIHNVVYVATEHDSVYAFDADAIPCRPLWTRSFLDESNGVTSVPSGDIPVTDVGPEVGISGTPVIDRATNTMYLVARTSEFGFFGSNYAQRLHALDITTGNEKPGSPVLIAATAPGNGDGSNGSGQTVFDPLLESQRSAVMLSGGKLFITFGGHNDGSGFHGWLLIYDAATLAQVGAFNSTPNGSAGSFAESGAGVSADASGIVYAATSHGTFDSGLAPQFRKNFGQTLLKFQPTPSLAILDTFTPAIQATMTASRLDFGSTGVLILPDQIGAAKPHMALVGGSNGSLYAVNRDSPGGFAPGGPDGVIKTLNLAHAIYGTPAYWQNTIFIAAAGDTLKAYALSAGLPGDAPVSQSSSAIGLLGASPVLSSNGTTGGIAWVLDTGGSDSGAPAVLRAFDATNLSRELYNSAAKPQDAAGPATRLAVPAVANGRVYVGTQNELSIYGLAP
jgi:hypothetical protein